MALPAVPPRPWFPAGARIPQLCSPDVPLQGQRLENQAYCTYTGTAPAPHPAVCPGRGGHRGFPSCRAQQLPDGYVRRGLCPRSGNLGSGEGRGAAERCLPVFPNTTDTGRSQSRARTPRPAWQGVKQPDGVFNWAMQRFPAPFPELHGFCPDGTEMQAPE